jgi:signal transduction histidine kinase
MPRRNDIKILYIDDDELNLSSFKADFRDRYKVITTASAEEALEIIAEVEPQVVIADHRMPKTTGISFFRSISEKHPDPFRVLLTGYTSSQTAIEAINLGRIDRFLVKPYDPTVMDETIKVGFEVYRRRKDLKEKNELLSRENNELNRFVYSVSHDLRAPLLSLLGLLELCRLEDDRKKTDEYHGLMEAAIHKMEDYIKTTLEYYRSLKADPVIERITASELIEEVCSPLANFNNHVTFKLGAANHVIHSDRVRLKIALNNLISNAVKYGYRQSGKPYTVTVSASSDDGWASITVRDEGKGIPPEQLKRIFEIFYSGNQDQKTGSMGLGLYLVKQSVERIGGRIEVRSKVGVGTEFELIVPDRAVPETTN